MITLVTDSTAYLTKEEADRLKLRVVPMHYTIAGNSYTEGFADENQNFVDKIAANPDLCATAQASVADFVGMFQAIVHQGGEVLCVVISSRLSGAYSSACIAAKAVDAEKVRVVDSRTTAGGLALLLKKAAKLIRQGYPLEDIVAQVKKQREKTGIAFSVEDMESLRKSGRLSIVRQSVGAILNIRPILCLEKDGGALVCAGTARGRNAQMQALADPVPENAVEVIIESLGSAYIAPALAERIRARLPHAAISRATLGPVLAIHIGLDVIGVAWSVE